MGAHFWVCLGSWHAPLVDVTRPVVVVSECVYIPGDTPVAVHTGGLPPKGLAEIITQKHTRTWSRFSNDWITTMIYCFWLNFWCLESATFVPRIWKGYHKIRILDVRAWTSLRSMMQRSLTVQKFTTLPRLDVKGCDFLHFISRSSLWEATTSRHFFASRYCKCLNWSAMFFKPLQTIRKANSFKNLLKP